MTVKGTPFKRFPTTPRCNAENFTKYLRNAGIRKLSDQETFSKNKTLFRIILLILGTLFFCTGSYFVLF